MIYNSKIHPVFHDIQIISSIIINGNPGIIFNEIMRRRRSRTSFYGLQRDLAEPVAEPSSKIPITIRPLEPRDIPFILRKRANGGSGPELKDQARRSLLIKAEFSRCFVAADPDNMPCYMQWLIGPEENEKLQVYFKGGFPLLGPDEVLLEGAYTPPQYRGLGIMSRAMLQISDKGKELGAKRAITFVHVSNTAALLGCNRAGFYEFLIREDVWRNFKRTLSFKRIEPDSTR
jgi:GNAT superfamily N-acetyltransferase